MLSDESCFLLLCMLLVLHEITSFTEINSERVTPVLVRAFMTAIKHRDQKESWGRKGLSGSTTLFKEVRTGIKQSREPRGRS